MVKKIAVLDNGWGDCGKGKLTSDFSESADWCVRFNGSSNSGHQVYKNGKMFTHHLLPSVNYAKSKAKSFVGFGMMVNPEELLKEVLTMENAFPGIAKSIHVDPDCFVITSKHVEEDKKNIEKIGSTGKGVSPAVVDKFNRVGVRLYNLLRDNNETLKHLVNLGVNFTPVLKLKNEFEQSSIVFEGAQSALLDINVGAYYPYCTSSDCTVSGIYSSGFNFITLDKVYGVMKPYLTAVGKMPFPTEFNEADSAKIRELGREYGSTTSRPRRIGALDLVSLKYGTVKSGINRLIITKMDILNGCGPMKVCTSYGKEVFSPSDFIDGVVPEYTEVKGWADSKNIDQIMPFVNLVQDSIGVPVEYVSTGVNKEDLIPLR